MRKTAIAILAMIFAVQTQAAFTPHYNAATSDVNKITGAWDSFNWKWLGYNTQSNKIFLSNFTDLDDYTVSFKVSRMTDAGVVTYISETNFVLTSTSALWETSFTNIPPNGVYNAELFCWEGATTNFTRTLAQGKINVSYSIYQNDDSLFPWPVATTSLVNYLTTVAANATYARLGMAGGDAFLASNQTWTATNTATAGWYFSQMFLGGTNMSTWITTALTNWQSALYASNSARYTDGTNALAQAQAAQAAVDVLETNTASLAQGAKADTAIQPGVNVSFASNANYATWANTASNYSLTAAQSNAFTLVNTKVSAASNSDYATTANTASNLELRGTFTLGTNSLVFNHSSTYIGQYGDASHPVLIWFLFGTPTFTLTETNATSPYFMQSSMTNTINSNTAAIATMPAGTNYARNYQNQTNGFWTTPYIVPDTNLVYTPSWANGNVQSWTLSNGQEAATFTMIARTTNRSEWFRLEMWAGTNPITMTTNDTIIGTFTNNGVNLLDGSYYQPSWKVISF